MNAGAPLSEILRDYESISPPVDTSFPSTYIEIIQRNITNIQQALQSHAIALQKNKGRSILIDCKYMRPLVDYLLSRDSSREKLLSFIILSFRGFCGLMMLPYGYGKIVNYDRYAADFFGDPIGIGDIPSLWLTNSLPGYASARISDQIVRINSGIQYVGRGQIPFLRPIQHQSVAGPLSGNVPYTTAIRCGEIFIGLPPLRQRKEQIWQKRDKGNPSLPRDLWNHLACVRQLFYRIDFRRYDCIGGCIVLTRSILHKKR